MKQREEALRQNGPEEPENHPQDFDGSEPLPFTSPKAHHHIAESQRYPEDITRWLTKNRQDRAVKVCPCLYFKNLAILTSCQNFLPLLQDHLLARLLDHPYDGDEHVFTDAQRSCLRFVNNRFYRHKVLRINYTTYDMRRAQDSINPRTHPDVMVLSHEDEAEENPHPYWYARVIGIFHFNVRHVGPDSKSSDTQRMDVLWVRWFGRDLSAPGGFEARRLHRVGFLDSEDPAAFGFLDPKEVVRAVHMIPGFAHGRTSDLLGPSIARHRDEKDEDWRYHYIGMCVTDNSTA
jgi:hypothetical protein